MKQITRRKGITLLLCIIAVVVMGCQETKKEVSKDVKVEEEEKSEEKPEDAIYSYLQGIKSYEKGKKWSGKWCYEEAAGQQFSQFGCGICSLANIYSSMSKKECTPLEMYQYVQEVSSYNPSGGIGAIGWDALRVTLQQTGFDIAWGEKPKTYEEFQMLAKENTCILALISSDNDDTYWQDVPGHYITIWLYSEEKDEVFLADSSGPSRNRKWIPLRYVYDALKTTSPYQYISIKNYDVNKDIKP